MPVENVRWTVSCHRGGREERRRRWQRGDRMRLRVVRRERKERVYGKIGALAGTMIHLIINSLDTWRWMSDGVSSRGSRSARGAEWRPRVCCRSGGSEESGSSRGTGPDEWMEWVRGFEGEGGEANDCRRGMWGKGVVLGVGRKVGSRNGSRGCCATINTPRDATRHVSLAPTPILPPLLTFSLLSFPCFPLSPSHPCSLSRTVAAYRRFPWLRDVISVQTMWEDTLRRVYFISENTLIEREKERESRVLVFILIEIAIARILFDREI